MTNKKIPLYCRGIFLLLSILTMKILSFFSAIILILCISATSYASNEYFDWENDMKLYIGYNELSDNIEALGVIPSQTNQNDGFSLWIYVDGREYRKFFKYDSSSENLFVEFEIPQDLDANTSIYVSVKDAQYNEVYSTIPTNYNFKNVSKNINNSVTSVFSWSPLQRDFGVFSMFASSSQQKSTSISPNNSFTNSSINRRQNVSDLTRAELLNTISSWNYTQEEIPDIISSLEKYDIISPSTNNSVQQKATQNFVPKYTRANEPTKINGIWNSSNYSSWRVGN